MLKCVRCGVAAATTDAASLKSRQCIKATDGAETRKAEDRAEPRPAGAVEEAPCDGCRWGKAAGVYPGYDNFTRTVKPMRLCRECGRRYEDILMDGPRVAGRPAKAPPNSYWFTPYSTYFQRLGGVYPCPAQGCGEVFETLYDVVKHFGQQHWQLTETVKTVMIGNMETVQTWQGIFCPFCRRIFDNESHLRYHLNRDHFQGKEVGKG